MTPGVRRRRRLVRHAALALASIAALGSPIASVTSGAAPGTSAPATSASTSTPTTGAGAQSTAAPGPIADIVSLTPRAMPGTSIGLGVAVRAPGLSAAGLVAQARLGEAVTDPDRLAEVLRGERMPTLGEPLAAAVQPAADGVRVDVGATVAESGRTGGDKVVLRRPGVYPLELTLSRDGTPDPVTRLRTVLIRPDETGADDELRVALVQPVWHAPPPIPTDDGNDDALAASMRPGGPLGRLARVSTSVPLTWAPVPDTLTRASAERDPLAAETWTLLRARLAAGDLLGGSDARTVATAWPALGADETRRQFQRGSGVLVSTLGKAVPNDVILATGSPVPASSPELAATSGAQTLVLDASAVKDPPTQQPFRVAGSSVRAVVPDGTFAAMLTAPGGAVGAAQAAAADALLTADANDSGAARGLVAVLPAGEASSGTLVDELGQRLSGLAGVKPVSLRTWLAEVPEATPKRRTTGWSLAVPDATASRAAKSVYSALVTARGRVDTLAGTVDGTSAALVAADVDVYRGADVALAESGDGLSYAEAASRYADGRLEGIQLPQGVSVQLTAREASLPIPIRNESGFTVRATLVSRAPDVAFPSGTSFEVTLPPRTTAIEVPIELTSTGPYRIEFQLVTRPAGQPLDQAQVVVRSSAVNGVAVALSVISLAVLGLWWIRTAIGRRRTGHHRAEGGRHVRPPLARRAPTPGVVELHPASGGPDPAAAAHAAPDAPRVPGPVGDSGPGTESVGAESDVQAEGNDAASGGTEPADSAGAMMRSSAVMATGTLLSRVTGFAKLFVFLWFFGQGAFTDIYNTSNNLPNQFYELLLGGILTSVLVPVIVEHLQHRDRARGWREVSNVVWAGLIFGIAGSILLAFSAPWLVGLTMPKYAADATTRSTAVSLVWMFSAQIFFYALTAVSNAVLNARRNFVVTAFTPVLNNLVVIFVFVVVEVLFGHLSSIPLPPGALLLVGLGTTAGIAAMGLVSVTMMWRVVRAGGGRLRFGIDLRSQALRTIARLSVWTLLYVLTNQIGLVVVQNLANSPQMEAGSISAWTAAFQFFQLPIGLIAVSLFTVLLPSISSKISAGDIDGYRRQFTNAVRLVVFLTLPAMVLYVLLGQELLTVLVGHGRFTTEDVGRTYGALAGFAMALVPYSVFLLVLRSFYAAKDTRTPMLVNVVATAVAIGLDVALYRFYGVFGLTLAFAASYVVASVLGWAALARRFGGLNTRATLFGCGRLLLAAVAMVFVLGVSTRTTRAVQSALGWSVNNLTILADMTIVTLVALGAYLFVARLLRAPEWHQLTTTLRRRRGGSDSGPEPERRVVADGDADAARGEPVGVESPSRG